MLTNQRFRKTFNQYGTLGRMVKIELAPYVINYERMRALKTQALVDFIGECSVSDETSIEGVNSWYYRLMGWQPMKEAKGVDRGVTQRGHVRLCTNMHVQNI